jgi:formyl-CoA transferase
VLRRPPPALGEHTDDVLGELGLDAAAIAALRAGGVV